MFKFLKLAVFVAVSAISGAFAVKETRTLMCHDEDASEQVVDTKPIETKKD